ncbi:hypothetical protein [Bradyrhizobium sp. USDA 3364]
MVVAKAKKMRKANARKAKAVNARKVKKAAPDKPARAGGTHVDFGLRGLGRILHAVHGAGLADELDEHLKSSGQFAKLSRKTLTGIKTFVNSRSDKLSEMAGELDDCDCPPWDTGCVYIPG